MKELQEMKYSRLAQIPNSNNASDVPGQCTWEWFTQHFRNSRFTTKKTQICALPNHLVRIANSGFSSLSPQLSIKRYNNPSSGRMDMDSFAPFRKNLTILKDIYVYCKVKFIAKREQQVQYQPTSSNETLLLTEYGPLKMASKHMYTQRLNNQSMYLLQQIQLEIHLKHPKTEANSPRRLFVHDTLQYG